MRETKEGFVFKADVSGVKNKDLEITMTGNRLTISGKREAEVEQRMDTYYMHANVPTATSRAPRGPSA